MKTFWRLPRGVDELLPPAAWELETLRRQALDLFVSWGFDFVEPPIIEYLDALLVGSGEDLDLQTLKMVDQVSGKQMGVRADMTSQAVRIDAHSLVTDDVQRLCYVGPVVFANPQISQTSRVPIKAGAEIFGAVNLAADAEVIALMLETMKVAAIREPVLLLGPMGIYRGLVTALIASGALHREHERELFGCVQRKSETDIATLLDQSDLAKMLIRLPSLMGGIDVLVKVREALKDGPPDVLAALVQLEELVALVTAQNDDVVVRIDVAELSGYGYHNGPVFAVYHPEHGKALAQGGRYDGVGEAFGRPRPATGFDLDLKNLIGGAMGLDVIFAPFVASGERTQLHQAVISLRAQGERVSYALSEDEPLPRGCQRALKKVGGQWQVTSHRAKP